MTHLGWSVKLAFLLLKCSIVCHSVCTLLKCSIWLHCICTELTKQFVELPVIFSYMRTLFQVKMKNSAPIIYFLCSKIKKYRLDGNRCWQLNAVQPTFPLSSSTTDVVTQIFIHMYNFISLNPYTENFPLFTPTTFLSLFASEFK